VAPASEGRAAASGDRDEIADELPPGLSVVIPTVRGGADLDACLLSLEGQGYPGLDVIVVDNASSDPSIEHLSDRFSGLRVLRNDENRGFVGASNQGIAASSAELVLLLNDDTALEPGALHAMVETLSAHPSWGACQAKLLLMEDPGRLDTAGSFLTSTGFLVHRGALEPEGAFTESDEIFAAKGAALLLRRASLGEVGTLDPDFFIYLEETDLCWRLWLSGWEVGFAATARVLHRQAGTASTLSGEFVQFHSFKNRISMLLKNLGPVRLGWMLPCHLGLCLGLAAWFSVRGRPGLGVAILRAIAWNAAHLPRTVRKRRAVQARRRVRDRDLMPRILRPTPLRTLVAYARVTA
jgi:GT2 family glycosyltransferase